MVEMAAAASASASSNVRLVNADGGSAITLVVAVGGKKTPAGGAVAYGQAGAPASVPSGHATLSAGGKSATKTLANGGSYTVVAAPKGALMVLRDGKATAGQARLRLVHAAPELGSPDVKLGSKTIAQGVKYHTASGYLTVAPGSYKLAVTKPNGGSLFSGPVSLTAGSAFTAVVAGSAGNAERLIMAADNTITPGSAPHTGLGGLAHGGGAPWLLAMLAALVAGALGGGTQLARSRRSRP